MTKVLVFLSFILSACGSLTEIQSDIWNIDPSDSTIYRIVTDPKTNKTYEEYFSCSDPSSKRFKAIIDQDLKKWIDHAAANCTCREP